jgi:hypothetical protein
MEQFMGDIYGIFELINKNKNTKSFINIKTISKQYLAYYIYRIVTKYILLFEMSSNTEELNNFMMYLRIPKEHKRILNYPLAGKMTNDEEILDIIILSGIDIFNKADMYLKNLKNLKVYNDLFTFLKQKDLSTIIQDLIDLQKLIPGLSVSAIRPNYLDDSQL